MSTDDSRRRFLQNSGLGLGWLALWDMLRRGSAQASPPVNPLAPKAPIVPATAKRVIHLFMQGGPSQMDTFDPKPLLTRLHGQQPPESFGSEDFQNGKLKDSVVLGTKRTFKKFGQSGMEVSDLFPHVAQCVDELAIVRSVYHEGFTHSQAQFLINNGTPRIGRPSLGAWVLYGLGSENENLPGFVVLLEGGVRSGPAVYGQGFLPAAYQGTSFRPGSSPILNLKPPKGMADGDQRELLSTLRQMNERHLRARNNDSELAARIASYELAFKMQMAAPEATDVSTESVY